MKENCAVSKLFEQITETAAQSNGKLINRTDVYGSAGRKRTPGSLTGSTPAQLRRRRLCVLTGPAVWRDGEAEVLSVVIHS